MTGNVLGSPHNVVSSNSLPFAPSIEEWSDPDPGELVSTAVMRVSDLKATFKDISLCAKPHKPKDKYTITITPIRINGKYPFMLSTESNTYDDIVCHISDPHIVIAGPSDTEKEHDEVKVNQA